MLELFNAGHWSPIWLLLQRELIEIVLHALNSSLKLICNLCFFLCYWLFFFLNVFQFQPSFFTNLIQSFLDQNYLGSVECLVITAESRLEKTVQWLYRIIGLKNVSHRWNVRYTALKSAHFRHERFCWLRACNLLYHCLNTLLVDGECVDNFEFAACPTSTSFEKCCTKISPIT